jgi:hypothetical protein
LVSHRPTLFVTYLLLTPVSLLITVTLTPGTSEADESVAVPRISPEIEFCA